MIAMADVRGVSAGAAGTAIASAGTSTGGVGVLPAIGLVGGAAALAGIAANTGDGSGSGTVSSSGEPITSQTILGTWNYTGGSDNASCDGTLTFIDGGTFNYTANCTGAASSRSDTGTWTLQGDQLTITENLEQIVFTGTVQGDSTEFTLSDPYYGTWSFSR
jgi:hypothetical protein